VAVHPDDDAGSLHVRRADAAVTLPGAGPAAYLDIDAVVDAARRSGCQAVHPGYGFLAENAAFATAVEAAGLLFIGPTPDTLALFGDKVAARRHAQAVGVPVARGVDLPEAGDGESDGDGGPAPVAAAVAAAMSLLAELGPDAALMIKAAAGGGGRGMRIVVPGDTPQETAEALAEAMARCASEARSAFGDGALYAEELLLGARHIEVQVIGDGTDVAALGERECSIQRQRQKLVEMAPAPGLHPDTRARLVRHALDLVAPIGLRSVATMEFLVVGADTAEATIVFCEGNARIQVEHTVTEEVLGVDLVEAQIRLAGGARLADLELPDAPNGTAVQARLNLERLGADGSVRPAGGTLDPLAFPTGPGIRVDTGVAPGDTTNPRYDTLAAKVIAHHRSDDPRRALARLAAALAETSTGAVDSTAALIGAIVARDEVATGKVHTRWLDENLAGLAADVRAGLDARLAADGPTRAVVSAPSGGPVRSDQRIAGARVDRSDPLAVLAHGRDAALAADAGRGAPGLPTMPTSSMLDGDGDGVVTASAPMQGTVVSIDVEIGDTVAAGTTVAVMEAMKMEHVVVAPEPGTVTAILVEAGTAVFEGHPLVAIEVMSDIERTSDTTEFGIADLDFIRPDLAEAIERHEIGLDHRRPDSVARRRRTGQRTARENLDDLVDPGTYIEYGPLVIAPQRRRRSVEDLIANTPADGLVAGIGSVNGDLFGPDQSRCAVMSYDYTVLAGTQGGQNHRKKDRLFELAHRWRLPVVFFTEGGGGRPGDTDGMGVAGLDCLAFGLWAELSGLVPMVGINDGYCFAGNAALLGCCDVVIATERSHIGMGGPAMIEGGGLGVFRPTEIAPIDIQRANGVVDIVVADEAEAVAVAKQYLAYFQGALGDWEEADQRLLRHAIPENRLRVYDVRRIIDTLADTGSVLELRRDFGAGMVTALARIEGRPVGIMANDCTHLAGAIDADAADKGARFMQLCDAFDLPIVSLCDTPGIMVGPDAERTALVRHASRMFVTARSVTVPTCTIVLRKGYGLGAQAMASGGFKFPMFTVGWPTSEFGGMGLEGAVKLGYRKELEAIEDPAERRELYEQLLDRLYTAGKGVSMADHFEIDDVIDPADSRRWIARAFTSAGPPPQRSGKKRPMIDTW
jgi:acetyl-CoA carboxylase carboxyltransferase component/acetyl/propionyl-CoA carboxylase alpha subunit